MTSCPAGTDQSGVDRAQRRAPRWPITEEDAIRHASEQAAALWMPQKAPRPETGDPGEL
jgi:hypothetical protein